MCLCNIQIWIWYCMITLMRRWKSLFSIYVFRTDLWNYIIKIRDKKPQSRAAAEERWSKIRGNKNEEILEFIYKQRSSTRREYKITVLKFSSLDCLYCCPWVPEGLWVYCTLTSGLWSPRFSCCGSLRDSGKASWTMGCTTRRPDLPAGQEGRFDLSLLGHPLQS